MFRILVLVGLILGLAPHPGHTAYEEQNKQPAACDISAPLGADADSMTWNKVMSRIKRLSLYQVKDGRALTTSLSKEELQRSRELHVDGYVSGIMILCDDEELAIHIEGQEVNRIRKNEDGSVSIKYFGKFKPEEIRGSSLDSAYYGEALGTDRARGRGGPFLRGGYSIFPRVAGDSVSPNPVFSITFQMEGRTIAIPVHHGGYYALDAGQAAMEQPCKKIALRYVGTRLEALKAQCPDFQERLQAIVQGIASVERVFGLELVKTVRIVDYDNLHNAVTCDEGDTVWFYANAFREEPLAELKTIAAHESLHKLVARTHLTDDGELREWFADLKGYDEFSNERFLLLTTGSAGSRELQERGQTQSLFELINEKNFLEDMKGGHSHANLDEFCASFIHSLLYVDRLEHNLNRSISWDGAGEPERFLTVQEKSVVAGDYLKTLEILNRAFERAGSELDMASRLNPATPLFGRGIEKARQVRDNGQQLLTASSERQRMSHIH